MLLGTWNLENLCRPGSPFGPKDKSAYEAKLAALAPVIGALDPALLGVRRSATPAPWRIWPNCSVRTGTSLSPRTPTAGESGSASWPAPS